jgi:aminoglycoside phosphotransferase (APT) family kinase protein
MCDGADELDHMVVARNHCGTTRKALLVVTTPGIDKAKVTEWLVANIDGVVPPFRYERITGGRSNLTFRVTDAEGRRLALRRPPLGETVATAHDMAREHRIISAVGRTAVPVPPALGLCTDPEVSRLPFYVMGFVEGTVLEEPKQVEALSPGTRTALAEDLIDTLADLHLVDVDAVGLGDFARRDGYIERQLKRWSSQWDGSTRIDQIPAMREVEHWLRERAPVQQRTSIVHGDYRFGNCMVDPEAGRIAAVLDWELCTLGDPLADVAYLGMQWGEPGRPSPIDPASGDAFPPYGDLVDRYAERTGLDVSDLGYYSTFSAWRGAVISEGVYTRYLAGATGDDDDAVVARFRDGVVHLAEVAMSHLRRTA